MQNEECRMQTDGLPTWVDYRAGRLRARSIPVAAISASPVAGSGTALAVNVRAGRLAAWLKVREEKR